MKNCLLYLVTEDWYFLSHRINLALSAKDKGYRVCVVCRDNGHIKKIVEKGIECYPVSWNRGFINIFSLIKNIIEIKKIISEIDPQVIHFVSIQSIITGCIPLFFNNNISKVLAFTGLGTIVLSNSIKVKILRLILTVIVYFISRKKNTKVIVQNNDDKKLLLKKFNCHYDRIQIIRGSGVDINYYSFLEEPPYPPVIVTFVGRFLKDKGIENLIKAFSILRDKKKDVKLWLVGEPDFENVSSVSDKYIEKSIKENKNIKWVGKVSDIKSVWEKSHIAVLPSKREGLPLSLLEAAACGKPIIASDVVGCREVAISGFNAVTFDVDNVVQLADAIIYLSTSHKIRKHYGRNSRSLVEKDMSEREVIKETIKIYNDLMVNKI